MINTTQISAKLSSLPIEEISNETNYSVHADNELDALSMTMGFFVMLSKGTNTIGAWTLEVSKLLKRVFSKSAISAKLQYRQLEFFKELLSHVLVKQTKEHSMHHGIKEQLLAPFRRVLVEDSMCFKLPKNLAAIFPGPHSSKGAVATGKIQCCLDIKSGTTTNLTVQSYRDNDQKFADYILHTLKAGDLVLRDLGYWTLRVFGLIIKMDAFFLSRYCFGTYVYDADNEQQINLATKLNKAKKQGQTIVKMDVLLGKEAKVPCRLVAIKVPQQVEQERRRKALKNKDQRANHSKEYMILLGWTIFVTNVDDEVWTPKEMLQVYGYRWRIETVFKVWKSQFDFERIFQNKQSISPPRAEITIYLVLCWITLFFVKLYNFFFSEVLLQKGKFVSIMKFAKYFKDHFVELHAYPDWNFQIELVAKYCVYDKRKIPNFCQKLYLTTQQFHETFN